MHKLALFVSIVALALGAAAFFTRGSGGQGGGSRGVDEGLLDARIDQQTRDLRTQVKSQAHAEIQLLLKDFDNKIQLLDKVRKDMAASLESAQKLSEGAARFNASKLEEMEEAVKGLGELQGRLATVSATIGDMKGQIEELKKRPAAAAPGPVAPTPGPTPEPARPPDAPRPGLPGGPVEDPEEVKKEIEQATADLATDDPDKLFAAIQVMQKRKAMTAVPRIVEILKTEKGFDYFLRTAAAAALGEMRAADAVEALADALTDKAQMVAQQANKSIRIITGFDTGMSPTARILERREAQSKFVSWWRNHEDEVRAALGQPKAPPAPK